MTETPINYIIDYSAVFESDEDFEKRIVLDAERFYDRNPEIRRAAGVLCMTRAEYIHRYALIQWVQRPRTTTTASRTDGLLWVHSAGKSP